MCLIAAFSAGCNSNSGQPPSVADVKAQLQKAREANEKRIDSIRNDPSLTADQKADMIARIGRGASGPGQKASP